jgi:acetyl/propionyl-CoA carboxylase alpha subunit
VPFLQDILSHPVFQVGQAHTGFLEEHFADWRPSLKPTDDEWLALAAFESLAAAEAAAAEIDETAAAAWRDPWSVTEGWRNVP